jgi:hypothetical protein
MKKPREGIDQRNKWGQFFVYDGAEHLHYSDLPESETAFKMLIPKQNFLVILIVALNWKVALLGTITLLTVLYFLDTISNLVLVFRSLKEQQEITFSEREISSLSYIQLPLYTIFCPLYHDVKLVYYEYSGESAVKLYWNQESPGKGRKNNQQSDDIRAFDFLGDKK